MSPLEIFLKCIQNFEVKPFVFWSARDQKLIIETLSSSIGILKKSLEGKELGFTRAYKILVSLEEILNREIFSELDFLERFEGLLAIYKLSSAHHGKKIFIQELEKITKEVQQKFLEYSIAMEILEKNGQKMHDEQKRIKDTETLRKIGIFYVLEYTVYLLWLTPRLKEDQKKEVFFGKGLNTGDANLPSYSDSRHSFLTDFCYKIFNSELRNALLAAFYAFEIPYRSQDFAAILPAFQALNLKLLQILQKSGIQSFQTIFLSPFGKDIPMKELITKIQSIDLSAFHKI